MFNVLGQRFIPKIPMEFYVDIDNLSEQEIELLSPMVTNPTNVKQHKILFEQLIKINPKYALYHAKYANILTYFENKKQEIYHRKLAYQYSPNNTSFIAEYIESLRDMNIHNMSTAIKKEILFLFTKLIKRIQTYQHVLSHQDYTKISRSDRNESMLHCFGYLVKFPYLSFLYSCNNAMNQSFVETNHYIISLNEFISKWYDEYYSFECIFNHQNCEFNEIFKYGEMSINLTPKNWNRRFGVTSMYSVKGRYSKSLHHVEWILNVFETKRSKKNMKEKQSEIIKSMHPMRISQIYLIYLRVLIRMNKFEIALEKYQYIIQKKLIDDVDKIWFSALKIELFAHLSMYYKSKSVKYIKDAFIVYNSNKQLAMFDEEHKDRFYANYAFLLMISSDNKQTAMHLLEQKSISSVREGGWIEYLNGYLQHYHLKNYQHAKYHYFASFIHNNQIPEVRYHLAVLMMNLREYKMSYIQIKKAIDIESCLPIININGGDKLLRKLRKKLKKLKCGNCRRCYYPKCKNDKILSVCKGCGKYYYCNKKCQKRHWNITHRLQCDMSYKAIFKMLKNDCRPKCIYY